MLVKTYGSAVYGVEASITTVEVNISKGGKYIVVGLPDNAVKESGYRVESALKNSGYRMPRQRVTVNLAPANIKKEGSYYDLAIALGLLAASDQIDEIPFEETMIMGELSLDGSLRPIKGALPISIAAKKHGFKRFILPKHNAREAAIVKGMEVFGVESLNEVIQHFTGEAPIEPTFLETRDEFHHNSLQFGEDFSDVKGQGNIKRALEIAASGGHNVILIGPPGAGKTMLAKRLPTILPPLNLHEALETTKIHSVAGKLDSDSSLVAHRPFRSPHHTISDVALVGGGQNPQPGEISLAHNGVLFLDELPEFKRVVLEVLRQPLEERKVTISRAKMSVDYPASFMLVASMNPCPCGYYNHPEKECICPPGMVKKYLGRISGPLLDRFDLHVEVTPVDFEQLASTSHEENSESVRDRVRAARTVQDERFKETKGLYSNSQMTTTMVQKYAKLSKAGHLLLKASMEKLGLSARAYDRILKVSRTIADLDNSEEIAVEHLAEAIQYRSLDRDNWGA